jgi:hypothetical protein
VKKVIQTIAVLLKLRNARAMETRKEYSKALSYLQAIKYDGIYSGLLMCYIARLMIMTKSSGIKAYIDRAKEHIKGRQENTEYFEYCNSYIEYLSLMADGSDYKEAGKIALSKKASPFVRNTLFIAL